MGRCSKEGIAMITPDYLNEVVASTERLVYETNIAILRKIGLKMLKQYKRDGELLLIPSTIKQFRQLIGSGMLAQEIEAELVRYYPQIAKEVHKAFIDSAAEMANEQLESARNIIEIEGIDYELSKIPEKQIRTTKASELNLVPAQIVKLEDNYKATNKMLKDLTNTAGYCTQVNFNDICDKTFMKIRQGLPMQQAVCEVIDGLLDSGIKVEYSNRVDSLETALMRAVRTSINQSNARIVLQGCAEMGVRWVKVSEHLGARVTGTSDYRDHSWWQGKVYSLDWKSDVLKEYTPSDKLPDKYEYISKIKDVTERAKVEQYEDFVEATGYGDMLGLCGINCRHSFSRWYPGINIDNGPQIDKAENEKRYKAEQKARAMERSIRKDRKELVAKEIEMQALPDGEVKTQAQKRFNELSYRVTSKTMDYNEFIRKNKLSNHNDRLNVIGGKNIANDIDKGAQDYIKNQLNK